MSPAAPPVTRIHMDVDPGHDDALAIMLATGHPAIEVVSISAVAGNQSLDKTARNALKVARFVGLDVPVAAGMERPLVRPAVHAAEIHGESGLDGPRLPEPELGLDPRHGVDLLIDTFAAGEDITLVPTGPLTNVAMALRRAPQLIGRIPRIVLMGGAIGLGNTTPAAEFNIFFDAEAADIVFSSGIPIVMMGLDVTHKALATEPVLRRLAEAGEHGRVAAGLLRFFAGTYREVFGFAAPPVHDACTVAYLIDPTLFGTRNMAVEVECHSPLTYGRTVCDWYGVTGKRPNAEVATALDTPRFWDLMTEAIGRLDGIASDNPSA